MNEEWEEGSAANVAAPPRDVCPRGKGQRGLYHGQGTDEPAMRGEYCPP